MNSALKYALQRIRFSIPEEVLFETFKPTRYSFINGREQAPISIEEQILLQVIRPRVLLDANLVGGLTTYVPLDGIPWELIDRYTQVFNIPKDKTMNRSILSVLSLSYMPFRTLNSYGPGMGGLDINSFNEPAVVAQRVGDSVSSVANTSTARVELIAENTVMVISNLRLTQGYALRCVLANDEELNNINPASFVEFANLCVWAVKSYIYLKLSFKIDRAFLTGGQELGAMKSYVESIADSEQNYLTFLEEVWGKVAFMNNQEDYSKLIRMSIHPGL